MIPLDFIVHHQKTLKKLELHSCAINVRGPRHCNWADIYKWLANVLKEPGAESGFQPQRRNTIRLRELFPLLLYEKNAT